MVPLHGRLARAALALTLAVAAPAGTLAQDAPHPHPAESKPAPRGPEGRRLPPDSTTRQSVTLPDGRTLDFTATAA